ncbi:hypothetical protein SOM12_04055 [Flavobacterium sp. CFBP9031]|uniref:hypothetical protein n=1 Tax=Flavobacterium sp. CFBP9031 TaxID=3096538 RepID=UPI002A6A00ED|nr:hypothetical protein [Flavobacterium sp. CFBP9031]MDY0986575.1 hypothetical protein [Flavobacterium sp. CFBP9031]
MTHTDKCRLDVLNYSLALETTASYTLGFIFDREDFQNTKSFGNTSYCLSFNQKMLLLLDYGAIEKDDKTIMNDVMSIRNQFLHNANCLTYQDAFNSLDGLQNRFMKLFSNNFVDDSDIEKNLEKSVADAFEYCKNVFMFITLKGGIKDKLMMKAERDTYKLSFEKICILGVFKMDEFRTQIINDEFQFSSKDILLEKFDSLILDVFRIKEEDLEELDSADL